MILMICILFLSFNDDLKYLINHKCSLYFLLHKNRVIDYCIKQIRRIRGFIDI